MSDSFVDRLRPDYSPISSTFSFDGFSMPAAQVGDCAEFVKLMSFKIYERIFYSALDSLAMSKEQRAKIGKSAADSYTPLSEGFIKHLAKAASRKEDRKIWAVSMSDGSYIFTDKEPVKSVSAREITLSFGSFPDTSMILKACALMYKVTNASAKGISASEAVLLKLEDLIDQIADQKTKKAIKGMVSEFEDSLRGGRVAITSAGSSAEFMTFDTAPTLAAWGYCYGLVAMITGYPVEFFNGVGGSSLSDTGASTEKAIARADKHYATTVINPFINELFKVTLNTKPSYENVTDLAAIISFVEMTDILTDEDKQSLLIAYGFSGDGVKNNGIYTRPGSDSDKTSREARN